MRVGEFTTIARPSSSAMQPKECSLPPSPLVCGLRQQLLKLRAQTMFSTRRSRLPMFTTRSPKALSSLPWKEETAQSLRTDRLAVEKRTPSWENLLTSASFLVRFRMSSSTAAALDSGVLGPLFVHGDLRIREELGVGLRGFLRLTRRSDWSVRRGPQGSHRYLGRCCPEASPGGLRTSPHGGDQDERVQQPLAQHLPHGDREQGAGFR
mmetsp:Transcript_11212/g.26120  ORF Transcript_11212/g.26120 Transcript_11212/m.26120 type:complete len:209 (-) Transcript_11212:567-1193(-)